MVHVQRSNAHNQLAQPSYRDPVRMGPRVVIDCMRGSTTWHLVVGTGVGAVGPVLLLVGIEYSGKVLFVLEIF